MNLIEDIKFAMKAGKEVNAVEIGNELHVSCKGVFHFVFTKEEAGEVLAIINPEVELTEKETKILKSAFAQTYEFGLPVYVDDIKQDTKLSKRAIVGVVGSLHKKGLLESYDMDMDDEFMVSEKGFELAGKKFQ